MAVQGGFVVGTLVAALLNLPDVINARHLFALGCGCGAAANAALALASSPLQLIGLRVATGVALAWVYPPGMKVAAGWFERRRGAALGVVIGALTIGSAFPHLLASASASIPWRMLVGSASALAVAGGVLAVALVGDGPYVAKTARFEPTAVLRVFAERGTRLATLGYMGHMWELYAVWTWIAAFATAALYPAARGGAAPASQGGSLVAFIMIASGALGSVFAGLRADSYGKARVARLAMVVSAACCVLAGAAFRAPAAVLVVFGVVWGVAVIADSAQLSALVAQYSPRDHVGTALTIQTCCGFLLTMVSIRLLPIAAGAIGWQWTFLLLGASGGIVAFALRTLPLDFERL